MPQPLLSRLFSGPARLALLAGLLAFGATGVSLALTGAGLPFPLAAALSAAAAALVTYAALRAQAPAPPVVPHPAEADLDAFRAATATLRHDLRGVLSPALMMSDRLLNHADPSVQRAGQAVVKSIERATTLLGENRARLTDDPAQPPG